MKGFRSSSRRPPFQDLACRKLDPRRAPDPPPGHRDRGAARRRRSGAPLDLVVLRDLKLYRTDPSARARASLKARFDRLFTRTTGFAELDELLARLQVRKAELLVTLERPEVPLNTNSSEQDVRDPVTIRKISGSTRGEDGRRCRDTFLSLKKTCQKNAISFWAFLGDRLGITVHGIAHLPDLIRQRAAPKPV